MDILRTPKQHRVHNIFASIVERYELLNTVLSIGQDKYWRRAVAEIAVGRGRPLCLSSEGSPLAEGTSPLAVIDLCTGTGSLAIEIVRCISRQSGGEVGSRQLAVGSQGGEVGSRQSAAGSQGEGSLQSAINNRQPAVTPADLPTARCPLPAENLPVVVGLDFCDEMLSKAREKLDDPRYKGNIKFVKGLAEDIPFDDNTFDCAVIAFGLRNVESIQQTFSQMQRVVKPGGKVISLELVVPSSRIIQWFYYPYLKWILPAIGQLVATPSPIRRGNNEIPYQYLSDSISGFMSAQDLAGVMTGVGLKNVIWRNLSGGVAVIHVGYKGRL